MKYFLLSLLSSMTLMAQSFYVLTGVDHYDPIVVNLSNKTKQYSDDIVSLMEGMSKEIGVNIKGHPSRVLVFLISDISMGDTIGLKVNLELGEYVQREGSKQAVFAVTYQDSKLIAPDFKDAEDVEDQLADLVEDMLEKFKVQYEEENKQGPETHKVVTHETFAVDMGYETDYQAAVQKAKKASKDIMIFMTTSYCPWCRKLEDRVLAKNEIDAKIKVKYVPLMLNLDTDTFPEQLSKTRFTPIIYIVKHADETIVHQFAGYSNRGDFLHILEKKKEE